MKLRVLPIVITGAALLLTLKAAGLLLTGHYAFQPADEAPKIVVAATYRPSAAARGGSAQASAPQSDRDPLITGSVPPPKKKKAEPPPAPPPPQADAAPEAKPAVPALEGAGGDSLQNKKPEDLSSSEKALLDRLQSRRQELDGRAQELELRENLLRAAEKRIEDQLAELKSAEDRLAAAENARKAQEEQKLKDLVVMYENMKPKQAAAIFDRLEMKVLVDVATKMDPKKTGDIIAKMQPDTAQRLTVSLARRDVPGALSAQASPDSLPKIQGNAPN